uniref:Uncharacterized protein n=1 Tax=Noccaea caerulescens TaxID=107243 RepID=A0A1J3G2T5_NOCCA
MIRYTYEISREPNILQLNLRIYVDRKPKLDLEFDYEANSGEERRTEEDTAGGGERVYRGKHGEGGAERMKIRRRITRFSPSCVVTSERWRERCR